MCRSFRRAKGWRATKVRGKLEEIVKEILRMLKADVLLDALEKNAGSDVYVCGRICPAQG